MPLLSSICVFCGSSPGGNPIYAEAAALMGKQMATQGVTLVYGGGRVGLMGIIADSVLVAGGKVVGVIPRALVEKELAHNGLTDLRIVETMHERKALMASLSDAFIAMPGGLGTFEELFEVLTWSQLGIHRKPCGLLNVDGFLIRCYRSLIMRLQSGSFDQNIDGLSWDENDPGRLLALLQTSEPPVLDKWLDRSAS